MRTILWIGGKLPEGMTPDKYKETAKQLADVIGGELVGFGETNHAIIGDNYSKELYDKMIAKSEGKEYQSPLKVNL